MADPERVELAEADHIVARSLELGLPEHLAKQLGKAGGEVRVPREVLPTVGRLFFNQTGHHGREDGLANTDVELAKLLLEHYPDAIEAIVPDEDQREVVINLWEEGQRPEIEAGSMQAAYNFSE